MMFRHAYTRPSPDRNKNSPDCKKGCGRLTSSLSEIKMRMKEHKVGSASIRYAWIRDSLGTSGGSWAMHHPVAAPQRLSSGEGPSRGLLCTITVCLVFNYSLYCTSELLLNDLLLPGPTLRPLLWGMILWFGQHAVAISGGTKAMFCQVCLLPEDHLLLHFMLSNGH